MCKPPNKIAVADEPASRLHRARIYVCAGRCGNGRRAHAAELNR